METVQIIKGVNEYDYRQIIITHDETGSCIGLRLSKECFAQLVEFMIDDIKSRKARCIS